MKEKVAIGLDLGGTNIKAIVMTRSGELISSRTKQTRQGEGPDDIIADMVAILRELINKVEENGGTIHGIGISAPGPLNPETGIVLTTPNLPGWHNVPLRDRVAREVALPVRIENDANAAAYGEFWKGAGKGSKVLICLTLGTGVGGGIVIDGKIFSGAQFIGAELGHMTIKYDGLKCPCGSKGCLEAYISATGIVKRIRSRIDAGETSILSDTVQHLPEKLTAEAVFEAAQQNDSLAREIMEKTGVLLGIGITNLGNIFNPDVVVIGGGVSKAGEMLLEPARREVRRRAMPGIADTMRIVPAALGDDAGAIGLAALALQI